MCAYLLSPVRARAASWAMGGVSLAPLASGSYPTRSMHDAQRLDTLLDEVTVELKVPPAGEKLNVLVLGPYGGQSAFIVRKDVPVCGGGYIHITDAVILPHAI